MAYRLSESSLRRAIQHLSVYGDTDVFPHLPEIAFLREREDAIVAELAALDLDTFAPLGAVEALAPKSRYGFRITHQLQPLETLLLLGCVIEVGPQIETHRASSDESRSFSYRFVDGSGPAIFAAGKTYKSWLQWQKAIVKLNPKYKYIVSTDISDFYARINFHRLENLLDETVPGHGAVRFIKKHIREIRATQSFGLPVGGSAARLLAELALSDIDQALSQHGLRSTRFVDDFRIFLTAQDDPYDALGFLAQQLAINEGLSLNVAKTNVEPRKDYLDRLASMTSDVAEEAEGQALDALTSSLYFDDEYDPDDLEALKTLNLIEFLSMELSKESFDTGRIKVLFRALKIAQPEGISNFIIDNFEELLVFARETVLLMEVVVQSDLLAFESLKDRVIAAIQGPPASSVQTIRTWLLEIFVRGVITINASDIKKLDGLTNILDRRQLLLIRGRIGDKAFFRMKKTAVSHFSTFERFSLVWGASCLPDDEFEKWVRYVKPSMEFPLGGLYLKWTVAEKAKLAQKLSSSVEEHPDSGS